MTYVLILLGVVVIAALFLVGLYNGLIRLRNRVEAAWAQIDVQLRRRHDLIPNLVETVKGYAAHERETLEAVIAARQRAMSAHGPAEAAVGENLISQALGRLFALSEAYPELRANQNFLALQEELTATEDKIAYSRQYYNDSVLRYNTKIQSFPALLLANPMGFRPREYFETGDDARGPVRVSF
jgi:LemA protein